MIDHKRKKLLIIFSCIALYATLSIHDSNLYPDFTLLETLTLSLLRIFILGFPVILGFLIVKQKNKIGRLLLIAAWLILLPYTIYSIAEIRHVSELCRLYNATAVYTQVCINEAWKLIPVCIYACMGLLGFVFSVMQVTSNLISASWKKRMAIIALCFYGAYTAVFGLYTRINMWELFTQPITILKKIWDLSVSPHFMFNVLIFTIFIGALVFFVNKILRYAHRFIR